MKSGSTPFDNFISEKYMEAQEKSINYLNSLRSKQAGVAESSKEPRHSAKTSGALCGSLQTAEIELKVSPKFHDLQFNVKPSQNLKPYEARSQGILKSLTSASGFSGGNDRSKKRCLNTEAMLHNLKQTMQPDGGFSDENYDIGADDEARRFGYEGVQAQTLNCDKSDMSDKLIYK
mmetsp:Transcript_12833/g.19862  ORF Transcript_12833/g.19862 Transcript_12833/m.19862 type:complete len:176 (-) Transcript_12833:3290-3817(-)|eukprot:CAMPEP_0170502456 /NCGR_PEP_ID=MMETSP0208-20121228/41568_1 /TAXON_ID=197538 /ORGANISM="Strombidium inclinatum, Strain S3" /LENGTH=175 /DNA_ID=CAMNT_0010781547 /DNA_START=1396 /DNA_END=1923 /DNA_ORIENTATION=+